MQSKTKYRGIGLALLVGLLLTGPAASQSVAFVDASKVVENSPQYEAVRQALETEFTARDQDLVAKQKQLQKLEDKLLRDGDVMSPEELQRLEQDIRTRRRKLSHDKELFREDFNLRRNDEFNKLRRQVAEVVREVGRDEGIDLIVSEGVVYASKEVDISDKVLERLKVKFKADGR